MAKRSYSPERIIKMTWSHSVLRYLPPAPEARMFVILTQETVSSVGEVTTL
jgi:hypothetical protein